ncbi:MAG: TetR/AcrR family transcriptional regulator [Sphingomonadales bacterium]|jgi:AcrR family transcriptional regulator|nr:TetR/AcrR family transcriptional regulator [Sphingomonadales bacterium]
MSRPIEFDRTEALSAVSEAFRRHGWASLSIKQLEQETGLSSGSLYNSFGNKDALFREAVSHYNEVVVKARIAEHLGGDDPFEGLLSMFLTLLEEPGGGSLGCLLTNSAIEFSGKGIDAISDGLDLLRVAFEGALFRLGQKPQARANALRLMTFYQGLLVLIRHGHSKDELRHIIVDEIQSVAGEH